MIVANEDMVVNKILASGAKRRTDLETDRSFCFEGPEMGPDSKPKIFFITKSVDGIGYTVGQLETIEDSLRNRAIDLFPLDPHLN